MLSDTIHNALPLALWAINPAFVWAGLGLASIPIIIHILNRRRYKVVRWAAMDYLLQAMRKNRRRVRFEQFLLLATRCLLLFLLGLALARPLGCTDSTIAALAGQKSGLHIFVVDNSYSMAYEADRPGARTHLDQAKILAKQQIDKLSPGSEAVAIISTARAYRPPGHKPQSDELSPDVIVMQPGYDLDAAKAAVDRIEQSYAGTDVLGALLAAGKLARDNPKQPTKWLYVLTDFTRSAWDQDGVGEAIAQAGRDLATQFGRRIRINNLGQDGQWNYAVLDAYPDSGLVTRIFQTSFLATVKGYGAGPETALQWKWDEQLLPDGVRLKPDTGTQEQKQTKANIQQGGAHVLSVLLQNDERLKADNVRHRVIEVASELKVLIVEGERGEGRLSGSGAFLDLALAPKREIGAGGTVRTDSYVLPELITDGELANRILSDYRAVILTDVQKLTGAEADQLERFVRQGGTLMLFMGDRVDKDDYNRTLVPRQLLPGKLVTRKTAPDGGNFTLDFNANDPNLHPLLGIFRYQEKTGLDTARIYTYYQIELDPKMKAEPVLKYLSNNQPTGDPAIAVHALDRGRVVNISTTANPDWTSINAKPAYVALIHELLSGTVDIGDKWMNLTVGQPLEIPARLKMAAVPVLMDVGRKQISIEAITAADGSIFYRSRPLIRPGLYQLHIGARTLPIAVNVPDDEADIRLLPRDAVRKALGDIEMELFDDTLPASALSRDDGNDLGWAIMAVVLVLAGFESLMAMYFGHYRRAGAVKHGGAPEPAVATGN